MADVTVIDPATIAQVADMGAGDTVLIVNAAGVVTRVPKSAFGSSAIVGWDGSVSLSDAVHQETAGLDTLIPGGNGYLFVDENTFDMEAGSNVAYASMLGVPSAGVDYVVIGHASGAPAQVMVIESFEAYIGGTAAMATLNWSGITTDGNAGVLTIDRTNSSIDFYYNDDLGAPATMNLYAGPITANVTIVSAYPSATGPVAPVPFTTDPTYLTDATLIPAGATPLQAATGWSFPEGVGDSSIIRLTADVTLSGGVYGKVDDYLIVSDEEGTLVPNPIVVRTNNKVKLTGTTTVTVPTDYPTLTDALQASKQYYVESVTSSVVIPTLFRINVEDNHTLDWGNEDVGGVLDGFTDFSFVEVVFGSAVSLDCTNAPTDNKHFITLPYYNAPSYSLRRIGGSLTAINVPASWRLGAVRLQGAATMLASDQGFFTTRGFTIGSKIQVSSPRTSSDPVLIMFDEELAVLPSFYTEYTTVTGVPNGYVDGKLVARTSLFISDVNASKLAYIIAPTTGTDVVPVNINQCEGRVRLKHRSGKIGLTFSNSGAVSWDSYIKYCHLDIDKATSSDDGSIATETPFEFDSCALGHTGRVSCNINTTPWPGTGYAELIAYIGNEYREMEVKGFVLPANSADYQHVIDADIASFKRVSFDFGDITGLTAEKLVKTNGAYEPILNQDLAGGARFEIVGFVPERQVSKASGSSIGRAEIGKYVNITSGGNINIQGITDTYQSDKVNFGMSCIAYVSGAAATITESSFVATLNKINFTGGFEAGGVYRISWPGPGIVDIIKMN